MSIPTPEQAQSTEPALKVSAIVSFVGAVLALVVAFGFKLTPDQTATIMAVTAVVAPLVSGWFTRSRVWSPASVAALLRRKS